MASRLADHRDRVVKSTHIAREEGGNDLLLGFPVLKERHALGPQPHDLVIGPQMQRRWRQHTGRGRHRHRCHKPGVNEAGRASVADGGLRVPSVGLRDGARIASRTGAVGRGGGVVASTVSSVGPAMVNPSSLGAGFLRWVVWEVCR